MTAPRATWVEGPAGWCPVQGIFDVERDGTAFRGYFRARGEYWSVEIWPRSAWRRDDELPDEADAWYAEGPVGDGPYFAGYLHHETCQALTEWALERWVEGSGGDLGPHPDTIEVFYDGTDRQKLRGSPTGEVVS